MVKNSLQTLDYSVLQQCMHCGMCLPSCPTFAETGRDRNSPRGRIALMRAVADGELPFSRNFAEEMSYCLGCLACTTACPAGVDYAHLLETARSEAEQRGLLQTPTRRFIRWFTMRFLFVHPRAMRTVGRLLWLYQTLGLQTLARRLKLTALLPRRIRELEPATPEIRPPFSDALIAKVEPSRRAKRYRVALLTGCVSDLILAEVNRATVDVLIENGCEVFTPRNQHCCGSLHEHNGDLGTARRLARIQLDTIDPFSVDAIISNAGGCGSHLKHYDRLLADDPAYAARALEWTRKTRDISEWLVEIGFRKPSEERSTLNIQRSTLNETSGSPLSVQRSTLNIERSAPKARPLLTYHESCHLAHGQKISSAPRAILRSLPDYEFRELAEATWCCGSAGIYNITQPATATWLQQRKVGHLRATNATVVAIANPGCHLQILNGLRAAGLDAVRVVHPIVLLAEAYKDKAPLD
ncbi:MAG: (Fe-S)-binding protein [Nibricoccus sp.]